MEAPARPRGHWNRGRDRPFASWGPLGLSVAGEASRRAACTVVRASRPDKQSYQKTVSEGSRHKRPLCAHPGHTAQIMKFPKADDRCHRVCLILEAASRRHDWRAPWGGPQCIIKSSSGTHRRHLPTRWSGKHSSRFCCNACDKPAPSTFVGLRLSLSREQHDHCQAQEDHADVE